MGDNLGFATNHEAEAAFETEHAPTGADVNEPDPALGKRVGPVDVVAVVAVATVDDDVARLEPGSQVVDDGADDRSRDHDPNHPRRLKTRHQIVQIMSFRDPIQGRKPADRCRVAVVDDASVPDPYEAPNQVGAHASETHHGDLHDYCSFVAGVETRVRRSTLAALSRSSPGDASRILSARVRFQYGDTHAGNCTRPTAASHEPTRPAEGTGCGSTAPSLSRAARPPPGTMVSMS